MVANPMIDGINMSESVARIVRNGGANTSSTVCKIVRDGGEIWAGSKILLADNLDLSTMWHISMKVYTEAPVGTRIKLELEGPEGTSKYLK